MKKLLFVVSIMCSVIIHAQDVIVKKDGSTILSKVLEVNMSDIKYKKISNLNGPTYTIDKSEVLSINYENGEKDVFNQNVAENKIVSTKTDAPRFVQSGLSNDNNNLIELYGKRYSIGANYTKTSKKSSSCLTTWGVAPSSTISNNDIEISFEDQISEENGIQYILIVKNKTDHVIYIDRGNSYRVSKDENYCYFNSGTQASISRGSGAGLSAGLGGFANAAGIGGIIGDIAQGISVGGGVSKQTEMTVGQQRFLVLPPYGQAALSKNNEVGGNKLDSNEKYVQLIEKINPPIHKGEVLNYYESNSPYTIDYLITYSHNQDFSTYSVLNTKLYLKQIFGTPLGFWSAPTTIRNAINKRISNVDKYCIVGYLGGEFIVSRLLSR